MAELERANAELLEFAHMTAHDLREPLSTIGLLTETLACAAEAELDPAERRLLAGIAEGVDHMRATVDEALASVRDAAQRHASVDMAEVVDVARRAVGWRLESGPVALEVGAMPTVAGDRTQLVRLMQNLLANALEHVQGVARARVSVEAQPDGDRWLFRVRDNGAGIDPSGRASRRKPGTGLGLAICRAIVERHGGRILLDAATERGAVVTFTLPAARDER